MAKKDKKKKQQLLCDIPFLLDLLIGIGEVSEMSGVSQRQLRYWQEKGLVKTLNEQTNTTRKFDYYSVKKIILIRDFINLGYALDDAASKADDELKPLKKAIKKYNASDENE